MATKTPSPVFRGYDSLDALSNIAKTGGSFLFTDPKTGKLNPALQAQVDQQKAAAASYVPKKGDMRYGFVKFGQGMDPEKDNRSWQEKFSNTKGAGLWAMGINPDDPQAEAKAQAMLKRILDNPKYSTGVWGNKQWGRDDAKMPGVRQLMAQNPNIPATELLDYAKRAPQAQNALQPRDIGGMIADTFAEIALTVLSGGNPTLAIAYGAAKGGSDTGSWLGAGLGGLSGATTALGTGNVMQGITNAGGVGNYLTQLPSNLVSSVKEFGTDVLNFAKDPVGVTSKVVSDTASSVKDKITNIGDTVSDAWRDRGLYPGQSFEGYSPDFSQGSPSYLGSTAENTLFTKVPGTTQLQYRDPITGILTSSSDVPRGVASSVGTAVNKIPTIDVSASRVPGAFGPGTVGSAVTALGGSGAFNNTTGKWDSLVSDGKSGLTSLSPNSPNFVGPRKPTTPTKATTPTKIVTPTGILTGSVASGLLSKLDPKNPNFVGPRQPTTPVTPTPTPTPVTPTPTPTPGTGITTPVTPTPGTGSGTGGDGSGTGGDGSGTGGDGSGTGGDGSGTGTSTGNGIPSVSGSNMGANRALAGPTFDPISYLTAAEQKYSPIQYKSISGDASSSFTSPLLAGTKMGITTPYSAPKDASGNFLNFGEDPTAASLSQEYRDWGTWGEDKKTGYAYGGGVDSRDAMNPMGGTPAAHYGLASLEKGGTAGNAPVEGYLDGPGDGMSDSIKATIDGKQPARLADGEFVIPADVVSGLGNGSSKAGAKVLYAMMDRIRKARTGNPKQGKEINPNKFLPA